MSEAIHFTAAPRRKMDCFVASAFARRRASADKRAPRNDDVDTPEEKSMRNDLAELTSLNRDYVASVQNSDVKRFDEILADDFYCTNPDKSLVDRSGFLKQTATPVTIRNLEAHDVKIRLMGDFAIIHA